MRLIIIISLFCLLLSCFPSRVEIIEQGDIDVFANESIIISIYDNNRTNYPENCKFTDENLVCRFDSHTYKVT